MNRVISSGVYTPYITYCLYVCTAKWFDSDIYVTCDSLC